MTASLQEVAQALLGGSTRALALAATRAGGDKPRAVALSERIARALKQAGCEVVTARPNEAGELELEPASADVLCGSGLPRGGDVVQVIAALRQWGRCLRPGGRILLSTPMSLARHSTARPRVTALLLHAGYGELKQGILGTTVISSGRVSRPE